MGEGDMKGSIVIVVAAYCVDALLVETATETSLPENPKK